MPMRGLTLIVCAHDPDRFHAALSLAAASAALGARTRMFLQGEAAGMLQDGPSAGDARRSEHGVPTVRQLLDEALALGAELIVCQSGLALCGMSAEALPAGAQAGGLVAILSTLEEDRLLVV
jgi:predicted peroxiredoxin